MTQHKGLKKQALGLVALTFSMFCVVSGGPIGLEPLVMECGPGLAILLILALPFLWAIPDALTTAELAPAIPEEGGYIVWCRRALGPFWGFVNAWWTWMYALVDAALYPVLFSRSLTTILKLNFNWVITDVMEWGVAVLVVAFFTWLNIRGTSLAGRASILLGLGILIPFALMVIIGLAQIFIQHPSAPDLSVPQGGDLKQGLAAGLGIALWNYLGWDQLSTVAEEVDNPAKAYPRAILVAMPIIVAIYLLPTWVGMHFFPDTERWVDGSWPEIAQAVGGPWLGNVIGIASLLSPMALFSACLLATSRVPFAIAEDRMMPSAFRRIHPRYGTPWVSLLVCGLLYVPMVMLSFTELVGVNVLLYSAALCLETLSLLVLRIKEPNLHRPFKIPGGWIGLGLVCLLPITMAGLLTALNLQDPEETGLLKLQMTGAALISGPLIFAVVSLARRRRSDP